MRTFIVAGHRAEVNSRARDCIRSERQLSEPARGGAVVRRFLKRVLKLGVLAGVGYAVWRFFEKQRSDSGVGWEAQPFPYPPQPRTTEESQADAPTSAPTAAGAPVTSTVASEAAPASGTGWVEPNGDACPATHPVKAKLSSKIFHVPGGQSYDRTHPDRCYRDAAAAEADGLRQAAR
jgi:hypothetical protein